MLNRRHLLCCGAAAGLFTSLAGPARAGLLNPCRSGIPDDLKPLLARTFEGLDPTQLWDVHTHLLGTGDSGSGCSVNAQLSQWWHPAEMLRKRFILNAACVPADAPSVDRAYVERLRALADDFPVGARWMLFAFDQACDEAGCPQPAHTTFHVPDTYAAGVAAAHADRFAWVASIHPYRPDALARLDAALAGGAVALKWLPREAVGLGSGVRPGELLGETRRGRGVWPRHTTSPQRRIAPQIARALRVGPARGRILRCKCSRYSQYRCALRLVSAPLQVQRTPDPSPTASRA